MSKTLAGLLRELNIEIVPIAQSYCRSARQTCASATLSRIFEMRGYAHLRTVLLSICETKPNKRMLVGPVLWGLSDLLTAHPEWFGDTWLQIMDQTALAELFEIASANRRLGKPRVVVATMLFERMRVHFPDQVRAGARRRRLPVEDEPAEMAA
jgi:hypothetical protein